MRVRACSALVAVALVLTLAPPATAAIRPVWRQRIGTGLYAVATAPDGSVYTVGDKSFSITRKAIVVKLAPDGTREWQRSWLPGKRASTRGLGVAVMPNGNVVWIGSVQGSCEGGGWFVEVRRPAGALIHRYVTKGWQCSIAETVRDVAVSGDLIVVAGYDHGCCGSPFQDGWVRAFDATGHRIWQTNFEPPAPTPSAWYDRATGVSVDATDHVYVAGWAATKRIVDDTDTVKGTVTLQELSGSGGVLWSRRVGTARMPTLSERVAVSVRGARMMVTAGIHGNGLWWHQRRGASDGWLGAFTTGGDPVWSRTWDVTKPRGAEPWQVAIAADGSTWVVGSRRNARQHRFDLFARRYSAAGRLLGSISTGTGASTIGSGVAPIPTGAYVSAFAGPNPYSGEVGSLRRYKV
jgi:hypothetical protein